MCKLRKHNSTIGVKMGNLFMQVVSEVVFENLESKWETTEEWEDTRLRYSPFSH
jgi:chaperonin cofactor prefoldin